MIDVRQYQTSDGRIPIAEWLGRLRDQEARARIAARLVRLQVGNRGDWKPVGLGVFELRVDVGPGYRVYCAQHGTAVMLLLCGGDKRTQSQDIETAHAYWKDYKSRAR